MFHHDALHTFAIIIMSFAVLTGLARVVRRLIRRDRDGMRGDVTLLVGISLVLVGISLMGGPYHVFSALASLAGAVLLLTGSVFGGWGVSDKSNGVQRR